MELAARQRQAVHTGSVTFRLLLMALRAAGRLSRQAVIGMFSRYITVTTDAGIGLVHGSRQLGLIDKQGEFLSQGIGLGKSLVGMTIQAGAVFNFLGREGCEGEGCYGQRRRRNLDPFTSQTHMLEDQKPKAILLYMDCELLRIFCTCGLRLRYKPGSRPARATVAK